MYLLPCLQQACFRKLESSFTCRQDIVCILTLVSSFTGLTVHHETALQSSRHCLNIQQLQTLKHGHAGPLYRNSLLISRQNQEVMRLCTVANCVMTTSLLPKTRKKTRGEAAGYLSFKCGQRGLHFSCLHAVGGFLNGCCLAVAALACQPVHHAPLVQQLLAAVGLGGATAAHRILEGLQLRCMLLRLLAHLHTSAAGHRPDLVTVHMTLVDLVTVHMTLLELVTMHMTLLDLVTIRMTLGDLVTIHMTLLDLFTMHMTDSRAIVWMAYDFRPVLLQCAAPLLHGHLVRATAAWQTCASAFSASNSRLLQ